MRALALALAVSALACGRVDTHHALIRPPSAPKGRAIELYMLGQAAPARAYTEVALVQAVGFGSGANAEDVARGLSEKAASLGCDAVVRATVDLGYSRANGAGVCVTFVEDGPPGPAPVLPADRGPNPRPPKAPPPLAPRMEPFPSSSPGQGGGR